MNTRLSRLRWIPGTLALVLLLGGGALATPAPQLHVTDVLGRSVEVARPGAAPTVIIFMSRSAKDASASFARTIDERLLDRPIESIGIVDVRRYGGWLHGIAMSYLRRSAEEARVRRRERRQARGVDASAAAVDRWHLVGDFDGSLFQRFGVAAEPRQPLAFVVDASGSLRGPFRETDEVVSAVGDTARAR